MAFKNKAFDGGRVVVAKTSGPLVISEVVEGERLLTDEIGLPKGERMRLTDITEVDIENLNFGDIAGFFDKLNASRDWEKGVRVALVIGSRKKEDLLKISAYTKHEVKVDAEVRTFETHVLAMDWLGVDESLRAGILEYLNVSH